MSHHASASFWTNPRQKNKKKITLTSSRHSLYDNEMSVWQETLPFLAPIGRLDRGWKFTPMNSADPQVEEAIVRVKDGAIDDYAAVIGAYRSRLRCSIVSSCAPGVDPDEIVHRAFLEAFRQINNYRPGTNFYGWLSAIARNLLLAEMKRYQRQQKNSTSYLEHLLTQRMLETVEAEPADARRGEEEMSVLRSCMEQFAPESRDLLQARYESQTPLEQVAQKVGKSVAAVKFQLFAIRKRLLKCVRAKLFVAHFSKK